MHATLELARRVDRAEIDFCALAGATRGEVHTLDAGGGRALFGGQGSPLNKVLGVGLYGPVSDADLDRIEAFYRGRHSPAAIELCPLAYGDVAARLCARGFVLEAFENELGLSLPATIPAPSASTVVVNIAEPDQDELWTRIVADGFVALEPPVGGAPEGKALTSAEMFEMMSQFRHPAIRRYVAWVDGHPAGGGAAWTSEGVLGIFGTATLPPYRRRGVQAAVAVRALADVPRDADVAVATTAPGSTSQRTFERLGFRVLYTRAVFVKA